MQKQGQGLRGSEKASAAAPLSAGAEELPYTVGVSGGPAEEAKRPSRLRIVPMASHSDAPVARAIDALVAVLG